MPDPATPFLDKRLRIGSGWAWLISPEGRMGRVDFFYAVLARAFAIVLPLAFLPPEVRPTLPIWTLAVILTAAGPAARRVHDVGQSGLHAVWLCFALLLGWALNEQLARPLTAANAPLYFLSWLPYLLVLALMLWPGTKGSNRYGTPPA